MSAALVLVLCLVLVGCADFSEARVDYRITTATGTGRHAQTSCDVMIRLKEGDVASPWITLSNRNGLLFRADSTNIFWIRADFLYRPCIQLKMRNGNDKWYADTVDVDRLDAQNGVIVDKFMFTINREIDTTISYSSCNSVKYPHFHMGSWRPGRV